MYLCYKIVIFYINKLINLKKTRFYFYLFFRYYNIYEIMFSLFDLDIF